MNKAQRKQILEWLENPITIAFKKAAEQELDESIAARGLEAFQPFQPERTQEILANLNGAADAWTIVIETLEGEGLWELEDE